MKEESQERKTRYAGKGAKPCLKNLENPALAGRKGSWGKKKEKAGIFKKHGGQVPPCTQGKIQRGRKRPCQVGKNITVPETNRGGQRVWGEKRGGEAAVSGRTVLPERRQASTGNRAARKPPGPGKRKSCISTWAGLRGTHTQPGPEAFSEGERGADGKETEDLSISGEGKRPS